MTDLNTLTKTALNDMLAKPLTASALKKKAKADLVATIEAQKPKTRKPRELPDRVMIEPGKPEDVKATKAGSKRHLMAKALAKGATIEELIETLGWNKDTVSSALRTDMGALPLAKGAYDLLWSEGAIYNIGFANGVAAFRPLLRPGGILAVSELTWLSASRPDPLTTHWDAAYPEVDTASAKIAVLEAAGYTPIGYFPLPRDAWMDNYYSPLRTRFSSFLTAQGNDPAALAVVEAEEAEIALYERYSDYVSYGFYIAKVQS